jgi:YegS/Rv2252/BmrU family lipid kinase
MQLNIKKNIAIVCNSIAGTGRAVTLAERIANELESRNIPHNLFQEVWPLNFYSFTDVFIVGGDGTLNYFVNYYPNIILPLVIFNGGTGNDFHWLLFGNKTFDEQLQIALNDEPKTIDIGKCNSHFFINGVGVGFEGEVANALKGKKKRPGKSSFLITILKKIFNYRSKYYSIKYDEKQLTGKKLFIDISNGKRAGGGFYIAPEAKADDGLFDIIIAEALNPIKRLLYLPVIEKGKHLHLPFIHHFRTDKIIIESDDIIQYHLDGEYYESQKIEIEILPALLNFRY